MQLLKVKEGRKKKDKEKCEVKKGKITKMYAK
jgi:hypothetical protein